MTCSSVPTPPAAIKQTINPSRNPPQSTTPTHSMLGSLKRGLLRPPAALAAAPSIGSHAAAAAAVAGGGAAYLKLAGRLLPRSFAAAAAVGTEQSKQAHKKARPFDKVRVLRVWAPSVGGGLDWKCSCRAPGSGAGVGF